MFDHVSIGVTDIARSKKFYDAARLPGHVELSAICVHPEARGRGYAVQLTRRLMQLAFDGDEVPFLHVRPDNAGAIALYERLGFKTRRELVVLWRRPL